MDDNIQKINSIIWHVAIGILLFVIALVFFDVNINKGKSSPVAELSNSAYPVMEIGSETLSYNLMQPYQGDIDLSLVRNQYTIVDNEKKIEVILHNYDYDITAIQYVLFERNPDAPLEEGTINRLKEDDSKKVRTGEITLKSDLKVGKDYYLQLSVRLDNSTRVYFYTKVQNGAGNQLDKYFTFAKEFHENEFNKEAIDEIAPYLETTSDNVGNSYNLVTIHSTSDAVTFGDMQVKSVQDPVYFVKELNNTYAVIELDYVISSEVKNDVIQYYNMTETYKLRYTPERMYLLDYNRTMSAFYNSDMINASLSYVGLGIQNEANVSYMSANDGYKVAFVEEGQLWLYDYMSSNVTQIYSYTSDNMGDLRNILGEHNIEILSLDDKGNIVYLLYGYMSRGKHEGENGILIMKYDEATNCNEEIAFLRTPLPYDSMKTDIQRLAYLNADNIFYCYLNGDLHKIDLLEKKDEILESGMVDDSVTASRDKKIIAIEKNRNLTENTEIRILDLETGKSQTFDCDKDKRIRAIGFLSTDFIYGVAKAKDVYKSVSGAVVFPIQTIRIMNTDGEPVKTYTKSGRYIIDTEISGNVLEMTFAKRSGTNFIETTDRDYIRYKEEKKSDSVTLTKNSSDVYGNELFLKFPAYVYIQVEPDMLYTKILTNEDNHTIDIESSGNAQKIYYVYAGGQQKGMHSNLPDAVNEAAIERGNVISSEERLLWQCIFDSYAQVVGMDKVAKVSDKDKSLAACLYMIASLNGNNVKMNDIITADQKISDLLTEYSGYEALVLTGCSTDDILYYVSQGCPVLAKYSTNHYVIVMSYNSTKIRYLDPVTGLSTVVSRDQLSSQFERAGNIFYSYLEE